MRFLKDGIGFFDSGIGGLTVLSECRKKLGGVFYYYGDNANAPYGNLSKTEIQDRVFAAFEEFASLNVRAAVLACNTATAICAESLRQKYSFPIVGAEPAVKPAAKVGGEIFILTTRATYESDRFKTLCKKVALRYPNAFLKSFACDALAGEIEKHVTDRAFDYTPYLPSGTPDAVVLGCTHYIYIRKNLEAFYGCNVYDGNRGIADHLSVVLEKQILPKTDEIFFLGSGEKVNRTLYERMFAERYF